MKTRTIHDVSLEEIFKRLKEPFTSEDIKNHPSTQWNYVPVQKIEQRLNAVVGMENWDFMLISDPKIIKLGREEHEYCILSGELILYDDDRIPIKRSTTGAAAVIYPSGSHRPTDIGNIADSAVQDAFKRCAKRFGIGVHKDVKNVKEREIKGINMKIEILNSFTALPKGGVKVNASYKEEKIEVIIWEGQWNQLQNTYPKTFFVGNKINELSFIGKESSFQGKKQIIFVSLAK